MVEKGERFVGFEFVLFHLLPVGLAVFKKGAHLHFRGSVEKAAVFAEHRVHIRVFAAPIHSRGEIDLEVIEADARRAGLLRHGERDVFAVRDAFGGVRALAHRVRGEGGQIPAAVDEGIVFEVDNRIVRLRHPALAQLPKRRLLLRLVVSRHACADDGDDDIGLQLVDLQRRQRIDAVGAVEHLSVRIRLSHFLRHTIHEAPHIVRGEAALVALGRVFALALLALADGGVTIRRHHRDHAHFEVIELRPDIADRFLKQFFIRVTELIDRPRLKAPLATIHREPLGMRREDLRVIRHGIEPVGVLDAVGIAHTEPHEPHGIVSPMHATVVAEAPLLEVGPHRLVEFRQRDRSQNRQHFAQFTRKIPAHAELHEETANRIERSALVLIPHLQRRGLFRSLGRGAADVTRQREAALINQQIGQAPNRTRDLVPFALCLAVHDLRIVLRPRLNGRKLRVLADERHPVRTRRDAIRTVLEAIRLDRRLSTGPDEYLHRFARWLRHDGQPCAADLRQIVLQLLCRESHRALRLIADDDLSTRQAVLDEVEVIGVERGE